MISDPNEFLKADPQQVRSFHRKDDLDSSRRAHHHTLGYGLFQAAPGSTFKDLLDAFNLSEFFQSVIDATFMRKSRISNQSIPDNTITKIAFTTAVDSSDYIEANGSDDSFNLVEAGVYHIDANVHFVPGTLGRRIAVIKIAGVEAARVRVETANSVGLHVATIIRCIAGDDVTIEALHVTGAALDVSLAHVSIKRVI